MTMQLPQPITHYFNAGNGESAVAINTFFTDDAVVSDENHTHRGHKEIQHWLQDTREKYDFKAEPINHSTEAAHHIVNAKVSGNFPGSPIQLRYDFTLINGRINTLEIS